MMRMIWAGTAMAVAMTLGASGKGGSGGNSAAGSTVVGASGDCEAAPKGGELR